MPTYVVTGANRGLGLEFARQLSSSSSNTLILATRTLTNDLSDLESIKKSSGNKNIHIVECDTGDEKSIEKFAKGFKDLLGGEGKIDYLLNNAGVNSVPAETSLSMTKDGLDEQIRINVLGPAKTVEHLTPYFTKGTIVLNMSSGLGSTSQAAPLGAKCTTYSISKAALNMLTVHQSVQLKENGVVVICMDPGWVKTRMGGEGAILEPEESIGGMLKTLHKVGMGETGKFYEYSGKEVGW